MGGLLRTAFVMMLGAVSLLGVPLYIADGVFRLSDPALGALFLVIFVVGVLLGGTASYGHWRRVVERHRRARGLCVGCGYDLRASEDRCPECGRRIGFPLVKTR